MGKNANDSIGQLVEHLTRLPGVGERTAERLAYHMARLDKKEVIDLADAIRDMQQNVRQCSNCCLLSETNPCHICSDVQRDGSRICVVEDSRDAQAIETSGSYKGLYHVLGGRLAPLDGIGPEHLSIARLVKRAGAGNIEEVIIATNADMEGDTTAMMVKDALSGNEGIIITRLARGLPSGSHLEYANRAVLSEAIDGRRVI